LKEAFTFVREIGVHFFSNIMTTPLSAYTYCFAGYEELFKPFLGGIVGKQNSIRLISMAAHQTDEVSEQLTLNLHPRRDRRMKSGYRQCYSKSCGARLKNRVVHRVAGSKMHRPSSRSSHIGRQLAGKSDILRLDTNNTK